MRLEQAIWDMGENRDEFFITVEEMPFAKEMQVRYMFNKIMAVIQDQTEQIQTQSDQSQTQSDQSLAQS